MPVSNSAPKIIRYSKITIVPVSSTEIKAQVFFDLTTAPDGVVYLYFSIPVTLNSVPNNVSSRHVLPIRGSDFKKNETNQYFIECQVTFSGNTPIINAVLQITKDGLPPPTGAYNYGEALQKAILFFSAQRSGKLPANFALNWRGDSGLKDGSDNNVDLVGGYHDAGDHVKFGLPMAYTMTMLAWGGLEYQSAYASVNQLDELRDAVKWGTDYLLKAHTAPLEFYGQVGQGSADHAWWGPPEFMPMARPSYKVTAQNPGSDLVGEASAAMTSASLLFKTVDPTYSNTLLTHAKQLFDFGNQYRGKYSDSIPDAAGFYSSSGYMDELVWAALWLYKATNDQKYLNFANTNSRDLVKKTYTWTQNWDDKAYGCLMLLHQLAKDPEAKSAIENWLDYWTTGGTGGKLPTSPGGLKFLSVWGALRYASTTAFIAAMYLDYNQHNNIVLTPEKVTRYRGLVDSQINYILGSNPQKRSYMVGFGNNPPVRAHHRAAHGSWANDMANPDKNRHILYGALVGGPDLNDSYDDVRTDYIKNEVALDYNAGFTGALAAMVHKYGGTPLANFPAPEVKDAEYITTGYVSSQNANSVQITTFLHNHSGWPPAAPTLMFRYFMDQSNANGVSIVSYYNEGATISGLKPWGSKMSYFEVQYEAGKIFPGSTPSSKKQTQLTFNKNTGYDPSKDWSFMGMTSQEKTITQIAVYANGVLAFGKEPPKQ